MGGWKYYGTLKSAQSTQDISIISRKFRYLMQKESD